ncbi:hypothetical protein B296_00047523 [Ensete ventricosum]|uniref:Uncharacterized protein n=1 Tax=Ensete ventricosum TaxID=4639 RepID=A0A426XBY2_ENSVE|nr:hypothetical protein B296_00047523 [Ensete ventricosum]
MRLYCVESFYVFLLHFRSEGSEEEGRLATSSPHAGPATHGQAAAKAPCNWAIGYGQGQPEREASSARKGRRLWAEAPPAGAAAVCKHYRLRPTCRGEALTEAPPAGMTPTTGAAASGQG